MLLNRFRSVGKVVIFPLLLSGCANNKDFLPEGRYGTIVEVKQVSHTKKFAPREGTKKGSCAGSSVGGAIGSAAGAAVGLVAAIGTLGLAAPLIPVFSAAGNAVGSGAGAVAGGTTGYAYDLATGKNYYHYYFKLEGSDLLKETIQEESSPYKAGDKVCVYIDKDRIKITTNLKQCH